MGHRGWDNVCGTSMSRHKQPCSQQGGILITLRHAAARMDQQLQLTLCPLDGSLELGDGHVSRAWQPERALAGWATQPTDCDVHLMRMEDGTLISHMRASQAQA